MHLVLNTHKYSKHRADPAANYKPRTNAPSFKYLCKYYIYIYTTLFTGVTMFVKTQRTFFKSKNKFFISYFPADMFDIQIFS